MAYLFHFICDFHGYLTLRYGNELESVFTIPDPGWGDQRGFKKLIFRTVKAPLIDEELNNSMV